VLPWLPRCCEGRALRLGQLRAQREAHGPRAYCAQQDAGKRFSILGYGSFSDFDTCDGTLRTWSATIYPENGKFAGGKALSLLCGSPDRQAVSQRRDSALPKL
jgi:hypothetical protein